MSERDDTDERLVGELESILGPKFAGIWRSELSEIHVGIASAQADDVMAVFDIGSRFGAAIVATGTLHALPTILEYQILLRAGSGRELPGSRTAGSRITRVWVNLPGNRLEITVEDPTPSTIQYLYGVLPSECISVRRRLPGS